MFLLSGEISADFNCATSIYDIKNGYYHWFRPLHGKKLFACNELNHHFATGAIRQLRLSNAPSDVFPFLLYIHNEAQER